METKEGAKGHSFVSLLCPFQFDFRAPSIAPAVVLLAMRGSNSSEHEGHDGVLICLLRGRYRLRVDVERRSQ